MENPYQSPESELELAASGEVELASLSARFWGAMVDFVVSFVVIFGVFFFGGIRNRVLDAEPSMSQIALENGVALLGFVLINGYILATRGQTLGKIVARTQIVSANNGSILPLWKVLGLRYVPFFFATLFSVVGSILSIVDPLFVFRADRRCLHDHIAGTKVIKYVG